VPRCVQELQFEVLSGYLRNFRSIHITIYSATLLTSDRDVLYQTFSRVGRREQDSAFKSSMDFLVRVINASPSIENFTIQILVDEGFVRDNLKPGCSWSMGMFASWYEVSRKRCVERFMWHLSPFRALVYPELKIRVLTPMINYTLTIQYPDLEKHIKNLQDTERRKRIREWDSDREEPYDERYDRYIFADEYDENDGEEDDEEGVGEDVGKNVEEDVENTGGDTDEEIKKDAFENAENDAEKDNEEDTKEYA